MIVFFCQFSIKKNSGVQQQETLYPERAGRKSGNDCQFYWYCTFPWVCKDYRKISSYGKISSYYRTISSFLKILIFDGFLENIDHNVSFAITDAALNNVECVQPFV